jgi:hypothetical protein
VRVFLGLPVLPLKAGEIPTIGGLALKALKKLKGARLIFPSLFILVANPMGLGATALMSIL